MTARRILGLSALGVAGLAMAAWQVGAHQPASKDVKAFALAAPPAAVDAPSFSLEGHMGAPKPRSWSPARAWAAPSADVPEPQAAPAPLWTQKDLEEARATGHSFPLVADAHHLDEELFQQPVNIERTTEVEAELQRVASTLPLRARFEGATCSDDLCRVVVVHSAAEQRTNELNTLLGNGPLDGQVLMVPRPAPDNESVLYFSKKGANLPLGAHADPELAKQTYGTPGPDAAAPNAF